MSALREALADYLRMRRALGFKLRRDEKLLRFLKGKIVLMGTIAFGKHTLIINFLR